MDTDNQTMEDLLVEIRYLQERVDEADKDAKYWKDLYFGRREETAWEDLEFSARYCHPREPYAPISINWDDLYHLFGSAWHNKIKDSEQLKFEFFKDGVKAYPIIINLDCKQGAAYYTTEDCINQELDGSGLIALFIQISNYYQKALAEYESNLLYGVVDILKKGVIRIDYNDYFAFITNTESKRYELTLQNGGIHLVSENSDELVDLHKLLRFIFCKGAGSSHIEITERRN